MVASRVAGTIPILIAVCFLNLPTLAQYSGGSGTADDPYQIATAEDLMLLGETPEDYDKHFIMTADIDLDPNLPGRRVFDKAVIAPDVNDLDGWFQGTSFTGVFDGNGYIVKNLDIEGCGYLGLFGQLDSEAEISNLTLEAVDVNGTGAVGGLVGENWGSITSCYSNGTVSGSHYVGGLVGDNHSDVSLSCSTGVVIGDTYVGGLVGVNNPESWGSPAGSITKCYSACKVLGISFVGGLLGYNDWACSECIWAHVGQSYSTGEVSGSEAVGGLMGGGDETGYSCFWDIETSGQSSSAGGVGKTTAEMYMAETFYRWISCSGDSVWTIDEGNDYPRLWWEGKPGRPIEAQLSEFLEGDGTEEYPYIIYTLEDIDIAERFLCEQDKHFRLRFLSGEGTQENPYLINNADELNLLGRCPYELNKHFKLMADIDLSGFSYDTALIARDLNAEVYVWHVFKGTSFTGVFDGNGHTISHLTIEGGQYLGLFGQLGGEVRDLGLVDVNIIGLGDDVGALAGRNWGSITTSYCTGTVSGDDHVGGLVGRNGGNITGSYHSGTVRGYSDVGGLAGRSSGNIDNTYSTGTVRGGSDIGGLVGNNWEDGSITSSFWDVETAGLLTNDGVNGETTAEMQTASTFLEAGWDFVDETANGPNDIWKMWDGYDYPRLAWEAGPSTPLVFVDINDPGFYGQMSKYEVTNAQYCDFLNAALASGDIRVNGNRVEGADGLNSGEDYAGQLYYNCDGSGYTGYGATNGGAARIHYDAGACGVDDGFGNHPVTYVSWYGAMAFANYYGYYLPTEDQWQAVADYDGTYVYGCGQTIDPGIANYRVSEHPDGTMPVGSFGAYGYGMSDMAGNVWEWTSSALGDNRVFRGGSMGSLESDCAVSIRGDGIPHAAYWDVGFRVCR